LTTSVISSLISCSIWKIPTCYWLLSTCGEVLLGYQLSQKNFTVTICQESATLFFLLGSESIWTKPITLRNVSTHGYLNQMQIWENQSSLQSLKPLELEHWKCIFLYRNALRVTQQQFCGTVIYVPYTSVNSWGRQFFIRAWQYF